MAESFRCTNFDVLLSKKIEFLYVNAAINKRLSLFMCSVFPTVIKCNAIFYSIQKIFVKTIIVIGESVQTALVYISK